MSDTQILIFNKALTIASQSVATNFTTQQEDISTARSITWQAVWTGGTGTYQGQVSLDGINFDNIGASVASTGTAGHGSVNIPDVSAPYFQVVYTGSGSGTVIVNLSGKS